MSTSATTDFPGLTLEWDQTAGVSTAASSWTDITAYLREFTIGRGRQRELDRFEAGRATFTLDNRDRRFDPLYTAGPYFGNLKPMRQIRLKAVFNAITYTVFYGYVDGWPQAYPETGLDSTVTVGATDGFLVLSRAKLPESVWAKTAMLYVNDTINYAGSAWYRLGESSGTTMGDSSINALHGEYEGGATFNTRSGLLAYSSNNAIEFNGGDMVGSSPSEAVPTVPYSIAFWLKVPDVIPDPSVYYSVIRGNDPTGAVTSPRDWIFYFEFSGQLTFYNAEMGPVYTLNARTSNNPLTAGRTYFVVLTYNSSDPKLYINGVLQTSTIGGAGSATDSSKGRVLIGAIASNYFASWPGFLDEVLLTNGLLLAADVSDLYDSGVAPWEGDTPGGRITHLLDASGWPASLRDLDTGVSVLGPATLAENPLIDIQLVEQTEAGLVYMSADGDLTFVDRHARLSDARFTTSNATFGDSTGEIPYTDIITSGYDHVSIINGARVARVGGALQEYTDATSQADYGPIYATDEPGLLMASDGEAYDRATYKVVRGKDPSFRVDDIEIFPRGTPSTAWPQVLGRELGDRITVKRRPLGVGTVISQDCHIEGMNHVVSPLEWRTSWSLSAVDPNEALWAQAGAGAARNQVGTAIVGY